MNRKPSRAERMLLSLVVMAGAAGMTALLLLYAGKGYSKLFVVVLVVIAWANVPGTLYIVVQVWRCRFWPSGPHSSGGRTFEDVLLAVIAPWFVASLDYGKWGEKNPGTAVVINVVLGIWSGILFTKGLGYCPVWLRAVLGFTTVVVVFLFFSSIVPGFREAWYQLGRRRR